MIEKSKTVCFSGHRILKLSDVKKSLNQAILSSIEEGKTTFLAGGALGFDTIAAHQIMCLKNDFSALKLFLVLPCPPEEQTKYWTENQKKEYSEILNQADEVKILSPHYTKTCMLERNRFMVDNSSQLICYLRRNRGGTFYTVNYAEKSGVPIVRL